MTTPRDLKDRIRMPSTYDSTFWHLRAQETRDLCKQMKDEGARGGMARLAKKYQRIALQSSYDEARIAFESASEALRVSHGTASQEQILTIAKAVDAARHEMQKARGALDVFRQAHLVHGLEVIDGEKAASPAR